MLEKIYASATGMVGGLIAFVQNMDDDLITLVVKTIMLAGLSSLAGQIVKDVYLTIRHKLKKKH